MRKIFETKIEIEQTLTIYIFIDINTALSNINIIIYRPESVIENDIGGRNYHVTVYDNCKQSTKYFVTERISFFSLQVPNNKNGIACLSRLMPKKY